ncbi:restriction endonuclease subunit S [Neisseria meningitidis]|uniref:restriction endonuclease subunit S n=1 Tax=Neisseria meningitidis TaxID=487 RepID=UPI00046DB079|nr:restriction endonuclease subunit S [Neisseria meningitidis]
MDMQSKAKKLIEMIQTAPVEWKPLGEVAEIGTGSSNRQDEEHDGEYPFYVRSKNILRSSTYQFNETAIIIPGEGGIGDIFHYAEGKYALHQRAYRVHVVIPDLSPKFLYYFMNVDFKRYIQAKSVGATAISIRKPMLQRFPIPIPPLEIQQKIVKILDKFTELEATLEATLEAELALRKRQYRYYRDFLLDFNNQIGGGIADGYKGRLRDAVWKTLGEVVNIKNGKDWKNLSSGDIPVYGSGGVMGYVDTFAYDKPSVLIPRKGSITNIFYVDFPFWNVDTIYYTEIDTSKLKPKFFYYFMRTIDLMALDTGSGRPSLTQTILNKIKIPIPPLPEQEKIVAILDKFDTLTHSISEGLPYEIALRRKQYEYYRGQLLSFPKAA